MRRPIREVNAQLERLKRAMLHHPKYIVPDDADALSGLSSEALIRTAILVLNRIREDGEGK